MDVKLVLFKSDGDNKIFSLPDSVTIIGRRHDCDLQIPLSSVSRRHCQLSVNKDALKIRDLGSRNGTYINGNRIDEAIVKAGDYLKIGPLMFLLQIDGKPEEIVPPPKPVQKPPQKEKSEAKAAPEQGSSVAMELDLDTDIDGADPFLNELEDI